MKIPYKVLRDILAGAILKEFKEINRPFTDFDNENFTFRVQRVIDKTNLIVERYTQSDEYDQWLDLFERRLFDDNNISNRS